MVHFKTVLMSVFGEEIKNELRCQTKQIFDYYDWGDKFGQDIVEDCFPFLKSFQIVNTFQTITFGLWYYLIVYFTGCSIVSVIRIVFIWKIRFCCRPQHNNFFIRHVTTNCPVKYHIGSSNPIFNEGEETEG